MTSPVRTRPVEENIPKVGNELAVGEDIEFQRRWWRFEHIVWALFSLILLLDLSGLLGRGPLAHARDKTADGAMNLQYDRVERFQTPAIVSIHFGANAVHNGHIELWVSQSIIKSLGNQRIIPQPASSVLTGDGILYTWPAGEHPDSAEFALESSHVGVQHFTLRLPVLGDQLTERVVVMP
ncbi:MAG: hypothetical protein ACLGXA_11890 [Acidobacteriota bacterium]